MYKKIFYSFLVFCFFSSTVFAESCIRRVRKIDVVLEGMAAEEYSQENILKGLKTKEGSTFSHAEFDEDIKRLADNYYEVVPKLTVNDDDSFDIKISLLPAPMIRNIFWKGNKYYSVVSLKKILELKQGQLFDRELFYKNLEKVKQHYIKGGFFESSISYSLKLSEDKKNIDVAIDITEGLCGKIKNIAWKGVSRKDISYVKDIMQTKPYNLFFSWLTGQGFLNSTMLDFDKYQIVNYFQNEGFCDVSLKTKVEQVKDSRFVTLTFEIDKGETYFFGDITIKGCERLKSEDLRNNLITVQGNVFSIEDIQDSVMQIKNAYAAIGFVDAKVDPMLVPSDVNDNVFNVIFNVEEGECSNVGLIHIRGNKRTSPNIILKNILLRPGGVLNGNLVDVSANFLRAGGLFDSVNVSLAPHNDFEDNVTDKKIVDVPTEQEDADSSQKEDAAISKPEKSIKADLDGKKDNAKVSPLRDIYVDVEEASTFNAKFAITYTQSQNALGSIEAMERNFNIAGLKRALTLGDLSSLRGGGEQFGLSLNLGTAQRIFRVSWSNPSFLDSLWSISLSGGYNLSNTQNKTLNVVVSQGSIGTNYALSRHSAIGMSYRLCDVSTQLVSNATMFKDIDFNQGAALSFFRNTPFVQADTVSFNIIDLNALDSSVVDTLRQNVRTIDPSVVDVDAELQRRIDEMNDDFRARANNFAILRSAVFRVRNKRATSGIMSSPGINFRYNSLDRLVKPRRGVSSTSILNYTGFGGEFDFWKFESSNIAYLPLWEKGSVIFRFSFGSIFGRDAQEGSLAASDITGNAREAINTLSRQTSNTAPLLSNAAYLRQLVREEANTAPRAAHIPLSERFYSGGETTVRGYAPSRIGPMHLEDGEPAGGFSYGLLSLEYRQEILPQLDMFYFIDSAFVSQYSVPESADLKLWRSSKAASDDMVSYRQRGFKSSIGLGVYLYIPGAGAPMAIGYGKVLNPARSDDDFGIFFSMGASF